jgi:hypothetical protein
MNSMSTTTECRVCAAPAHHCFDGTVLSHKVAYFECPECGYLQTETPYWLEEAYGTAINRSDTGILRRNERTARVVIRVLALLGRLHGTVIDCAGGYGLLVRMLRDRGVDARWSDRYCDNLVARGFEAGDNDRADLITAFEAMEHFVHPTQELGRLLERADHVLVSTDLVADPAPQPGTWWYYGAEHGQHIGFFRPRTLQWLARRLGCHVLSDGKSFHLFTRQAIPEWRWTLARRTAKWAPLWARLHLRSRMWSDHAEMVKADQERARQRQAAPVPGTGTEGTR